jgi:hypothetical protein
MPGDDFQSIFTQVVLWIVSEHMHCNNRCQLDMHVHHDGGLSCLAMVANIPLANKALPDNFLD